MTYVEPGYAESQSRYFGQPGSQTRFTASDGQTLNFEQSPLRPPVDLDLLQAESKSAAGVRFGHGIYGADQGLKLRWPRLYVYYRDRLLDWFRSVVNGQSDSFVYRDKDGADHTVRFASPELPEIRELTADRYQVEIELVIES